MSKKLSFEKNGILIAQYFAELYGYDYIAKEDSWLMFYICVSKLLNSYNKEIGKELRLHYNIKIRIYFICSFNTFLWELLKFIIA